MIVIKNLVQGQKFDYYFVIMSSGLLGMVSSALAVSIIHPIDVVKSNYQHRPGTSVLNNIKYIREQSKSSLIRSFYRGLLPQLATYPVFYGTFFMMNETLSSSSKNYGVPGQISQTLLSSGLATFVSNPFFVLKVRFQTDFKNTCQNVGYYNYTKKIIKEEGLVALQKGFKASLVNNMKLGLQFPLTYYLDNKINTGYKPIDMAGASFVAKFLTSSLFYPTDLIRIEQRASKLHLSMRTVATKIIKKDGLSGLWRGLLLYNSVSIPSYVLTMVILKWLKDHWLDHEQ